MTIKARLLLILVGGILLLFGASFYSNQQLSEANASYNAEASITSYTSAWFGSLDGGYVTTLKSTTLLTARSQISISGTLKKTPIRMEKRIHFMLHLGTGMSSR